MIHFVKQFFLLDSTKSHFQHTNRFVNTSLVIKSKHNTIKANDLTSLDYILNNNVIYTKIFIYEK